MSLASNPPSTSSPEPTRWTRPQQLLATGYGVWSAVWTIVIGAVLRTPARVAATMAHQGYPADEIRKFSSELVYRSGLAGAVGSALLCLLIAYLSYRGRNWAFWVALVWFTITGFGVFWVPLRANMGEEGLTLIIHAFVNDMPGLAVAGWMLAGLLRYGRPWAMRRPSQTTPTSWRDHNDQHPTPGSPPRTP